MELSESVIAIDSVMCFLSFFHASKARIKYDACGEDIFLDVWSAPHGGVEPVGKPLKVPVFDGSGGGSKVSDRNRMCDVNAPGPQ